MSQNREAQRDWHRAEYDYQVNKKAEREIEDMQKDLEQIKKLVNELHSKLVRKDKKMENKIMRKFLDLFGL